MLIVNIMKAFKRGENLTNKFDKIFTMYNKDLFRLIFSYTLNVTETKDILQETFMKYYQKMNFLPDDEIEIKKWLIRVAINKAKDYQKCWKNWVKNLDDNNHILKKSDINLEMLDLLNRIDKKYRLPIYLYYYEGYRISEISSLLKISKSAVKMRLSRAKEILKKEMEVIK